MLPVRRQQLGSGAVQSRAPADPRLVVGRRASRDQAATEKQRRCRRTDPSPTDWDRAQSGNPRIDPAVNLIEVQGRVILDRSSIGNESAPMQLAQCRFPAWAGHFQC